MSNRIDSPGNALPPATTGESSDAGTSEQVTAQDPQEPVGPVGPVDAVVSNQRPGLTLSPTPTIGVAPPAPRGDQRTLWLGATGGPGSLKLGDAETYASGARALGLGADWLAKHYPELNENFFYRFAELTTSAAVTMPWLIYNHELGHASVAQSFGWETDVQMTSWLSGYTRYTFDADGYTTEERFRASAAGVNRSTSNAEYLARDWSRNGSANLQEAVAYLTARADLTNYIARTVRLQESGAPISSGNDIASVERLWQEMGRDISAKQMLTASLATHLLSAADWVALIGTGKFLATGDRQIELPSLEIGGMSLTPPLFSAYLTTQGPLVAGTMTVNPDRKMPVEIDIATTLDQSAFSAGAKLHNVPVVNGLSVNPFLAVTQSDEHGTGYRIGSEAHYQVSKSIEVKAKVSFNQHDLMTQAYGEYEGLNVGVHLGIRF